MNVKGQQQHPLDLFSYTDASRMCRDLLQPLPQQQKCVIMFSQLLRRLSIREKCAFHLFLCNFLGQFLLVFFKFNLNFFSLFFSQIFKLCMICVCVCVCFKNKNKIGRKKNTENYLNLSHPFFSLLFICFCCLILCVFQLCGLNISFLKKKGGYPAAKKEKKTKKQFPNK